MDHDSNSSGHTNMQALLPYPEVSIVQSNRVQIFCWQIRRMLLTRLRNFASDCILEATPRDAQPNTPAHRSKPFGSFLLFQIA